MRWLLLPFVPVLAIIAVVLLGMAAVVWLIRQLCETPAPQPVRIKTAKGQTIDIFA